jgi:hypothetical protein
MNGSEPREMLPVAHRARDVAHDTIEPLVPSLAHETTSVVHPREACVGAHDPVFDIERRPVAHLLPCLLHPRTVFGMDQFLPQIRVGAEILGRPSIDGFARLADEFDLLAGQCGRPQHVGERRRHIVQPLLELRERRFRAVALGVQPRFLHATFDRRRKAPQIRLEDVIARPRVQRADRRLFADGARYENEGDVGHDATRKRQRRQAVEMRHREIGDDGVGTKLGDGGAHCVLGLHHPARGGDTRPAQLVHLELDVSGDVLDDQKPQRRFGRRVFASLRGAIRGHDW